MNCLTRIRQRYPILAASDRKLADHILSQPDETRHLSSQQLTAEAGVSRSSVVKFAQKLGFKGLPALELVLSEVLASSPDPCLVPVYNYVRGDDSLRLVDEKLIKDNATTMHVSLDVNTGETLWETVIPPRNAQRVIVTNIGVSGLMTRNFSWKLMKIDINAISEQDMHALLAAVQAMPSGDLLLAISYFGERREINMAAGEALHVDYKTLVIIGFSPNALRQQATRRLYAIAEEQATRSVAISSISAQMMFTNLLFMGLVWQDPERTSEHIRHNEALVKKLV